METQEQNSFLPQDVMIEILMRLPFESILTFKRVSKQWKNLINDPTFFNRYRDKSLTVLRNEDGLYGLLVRVNRRPHSHPPVTMRQIITDNSPIRENPHWRAVVLCNWMTYHATKGDFHLYNVLTGALYPVTDSPIREYPHWGVYHGFVYDGYEDDYKILVACHCGFKGLVDPNVFKKFFQNEDDGLFWVYSLRNRVWKRLEGFPYTAYNWSVRPSFKPWSYQPCSLNGVLHWGVARRGVGLRKSVIVTYDLHTLRFGEILLPDDYNDLWPKLGELGGKLCCWEPEFEFKVWMMEEYGVRESWTLLCRIDGSTVDPKLSARMEPVALYECQDGRKLLLLVCRLYGKLFWYDIHNDEMEVIDQVTWRERRVISVGS